MNEMDIVLKKLGITEETLRESRDRSNGAENMKLLAKRIREKSAREADLDQKAVDAGRVSRLLVG